MATLATAAIAASVPIAGSFSPAVGRSLHVAEPYQAWSRDTAARLTPRAQAAAKAAEGARGYKESPVGLVASAEAAAAQAEAAAARAERRADAAEAAERRKRASLGLPAALQPEPEQEPARDFSIFVDVFEDDANRPLSRKWVVSSSS